MIKMARLKLSSYNDVEFLAANFRDLDVNEEYNAVIFSLALHHLQPEEQKLF
jgi:tRNA (cmo5U34)-methyltransferase